jgi:hypothetical protein
MNHHAFVEAPVVTAVTDRFMSVPSHSQTLATFRAFREATSNRALIRAVCVVCAREMWGTEGVERIVSNVKGIHELLTLIHAHPDQELWEGIPAHCHTRSSERHCRCPTLLRVFIWGCSRS